MRIIRGSVARNKKGQIGIVLGWLYNHRKNGERYKFSGIGLCGGDWRSFNQPEFVAKNIKEYIVTKGLET